MVSWEGLQNLAKMDLELDIKLPASVFTLIVTERRYVRLAGMSNRYEENNDEQSS